MDPNTLKNVKKAQVCELCLRHDPMVKNYADDFELQTALRNLIEKQTGDTINVTDIAHLCDSCYLSVSDMAKKKDY
jgi:hypothetical protein